MNECLSTQKCPDSVVMSSNPNLTPGENAVYQHMIRGRTQPECAEILGLKLNTVKTHTKRIFRKKGVHSHIELITKALQSSGCKCLEHP